MSMNNNMVNPKNSKELKKAIIDSFKEAFDQGLIKGCTIGEIRLAIEMIGGEKYRKCITKNGVDISKIFYDVEYQIKINRCARKNIKKKTLLKPEEGISEDKLKAQYPSAGSHSQITRKEWGSAFKPAKG